MTIKKCITCMRGPQHFEGCSHVECPVRRQVTAAPVGEAFLSSPHLSEGIAGNGGMRRDPMIGESE